MRHADPECRDEVSVKARLHRQIDRAISEASLDAV